MAKYSLSRRKTSNNSGTAVTQMRAAKVFADRGAVGAIEAAMTEHISKVNKNGLFDPGTL